MIARTAPPPTTVPRFAWLTDGDDRSYRLQKFLEVTRVVMDRRGKTPSPAYLAAIEALYRQSVE